jgi:hypothetical protein
LPEILTDGYFRSINGYGNFIPAWVAAWPAAAMLHTGVSGPQFAVQFNLFMKASDARVVVMPERYEALWGPALASAGWQGHAVGRYLVYRIDTATWAEIPDETVSAAAYQAVSAHLQALKQAAQCTLKQGAHRLDPDKAVAAGCLALAYRSSLAGTAVNWDWMGGWLGFFGQGVAVGVMTDSTIAKQLAVAAGPGLETILFPYPETYDPKANDTNRSGQFLAVYNVQTLLDDRSGDD